MHKLDCDSEFYSVPFVEGMDAPRQPPEPVDISSGDSSSDDDDIPRKAKRVCPNAENLKPTVGASSNVDTVEPTLDSSAKVDTAVSSPEGTHSTSKSFHLCLF